jgi:peptidoglycan pentaglycine glycine transferase (the first glycine)
MVLQVSNEIKQFVCHGPEEVREWDHFLSKHPHAHIEQTGLWGRLKQIYGWDPVWVWITRDDKILGGAMFLNREFGPITVGYIERGPVWDPSIPDSLEMVTKAICDFAASTNIAYMVIAPPYCGDDLAPLLQTRKFRLKPEPLPPRGVGRATLLIDLRQDLNAMLADMSMAKRQNIRRAIRKGVRVRVGESVEDANIVRDLMWTACKRRGTLPRPPQSDFFESLWRELGPSGATKFFIAEIDGQPVSAAAVQIYGNVMQLWRVGWSGTHDHYNPNDLLHWEMMKWAKENGCHTFDFMHIEPHHAEAILRGERIKDSYSGVTDFKTSFGGQLRVLPELCYRSFNPLIQSVFNAGVARIMETQAGAELTNKAIHRFTGFESL